MTNLPVVFSRVRTPILKMGSWMTYKMLLTPRTIVVLRKLRFGRMGMFLFKKRSQRQWL